MAYVLIRKLVRPFSGTDVYPHMPIVRLASALDESASARATRYDQAPYKLCNRINPILGFWGASGGAMFLLMTPMKRRAKFDAASFILAGEIRNRTNT